MRPATLAEATRRIVDGAPQEKALPEFLDTFLSGIDERAAASDASLERPVDTGDHHLDAFLGAAAEYLARQYQLIPFRIGSLSPTDISNEQWHVSQLDSPGDARIPDLRQPRRIPLAQHIHRRTSAPPRSRPSMIPKSGVRFSDQIMLKNKVARLTRPAALYSNRA